MNEHPSVSAFVSKPGQWQAEFQRLRAIVRAAGLTEDFKWGTPCYTHNGQNVVLIHGFKTYCALLFFKGALMADPDHILVQQTANVQSARQLRFTSRAQIEALDDTIAAYLQEAVRVEAAGLKVEFKKAGDFAVAAEFQERLDALPALRDAFRALTPGRQKAYLLHFAGAKLARTRAARVEHCIPRILDGLGLDD